jgi:hypothetical protein
MWGIILVTKQKSAPFQLAHTYLSHSSAKPTNQPTNQPRSLSILAGAHWLLFFSTLLRRVFPSLTLLKIMFFFNLAWFEFLVSLRLNFKILVRIWL